MRPTRTNTGGILPGQIDRITRRHRLEHDASIDEAVAAIEGAVVTSLNTGSNKPPITGPVTLTGQGGASVSNTGSTITIDVTELKTLINQIVNGDITTMSGVPAGIIAFWSGSLATIPAGWAPLGGVDGAFLKLGSVAQLSPTVAGHLTIPKDALDSGTGDASQCINDGSGTTYQVSLASHVHTSPQGIPHSGDYDLGAVPDPSNVTLIPIIKL